MKAGVGKAAGVALALAVVGTLALSYTDAIQEVFVRNWPKVFPVEGMVEVKGPLSHSEMVRREGVIVTTSHRTEVSELVPAGSIETGGYTSVTVSLQGEVKASNTLDGTVGVLLVPEEEPVLRALRDAKRLQFPIEAACQLAKGGPGTFESGPITQPVGFPRYRIFLYNTAPHAVEANVYLYLKN